MMRLFYLTLICVVAVTTSACTPRQQIKYSMDDISATSNSPFAKTILAVKPFEDHRKPLITDCPNTEVSKVEKDGKTFYYNCDNLYKTDSLTKEITTVVTDHLNRSRLFDQVILTDVPPANADYLLLGRVSKFDGLKEYDLGAVVAAQFGLIGALINLAMDSSYEGTTVLDGLQLIRLKDKTMVWSGDVTGHVEGKDTVDGWGWASYWKANLSLKEANSNLVNILGKINVNAVKSESEQNANVNGAEASKPVAQSPQSP